MKKRDPYPYKDYPVLGYRVTKDVYGALTGQLEDVLDAWNRTLDKTDKPYKKNDIFIKALKRGLSHMKSEKESK